MKIIQVDTIPVKVPIKPGMTMKTAHGEHVDSRYVIIRVHTDAGITGLGEATVGPRWNGENATGCKAVIDEFLTPLLIGVDPLERSRIRAKMDEEIKLHPFAKAAIEMALFDIAGKFFKVPVYQLLGGAVRKPVPIKMVVGGFPPAQAVKLALQFAEAGTTHIKIKVGIQLAEDIERLRAIREAVGPHIWLSIDANGGWSLSTAKMMLAYLEDFDIRLIEQPIPPGDPGALADLRSRTEIPIMADESAFNLTEAWTVAAARAADVISVYPGKNGGIIPAIEIAHLAKAAGLACHMGSNLELGIATAAMLHLAAACSTIDCESYPADILGPLYHQWDVIKQPLQLGPNVAVVPEGPGLGVEL
ncbi:MAG: mandelate racemase/muconate lactonizing protein, partial [Planctomycetes bacterium]|nr:mandelate racemase/muconate lactonizing protein [Planctomycetota bacterium]